jgi:hypothetical protein
MTESCKIINIFDMFDHGVHEVDESAYEVCSEGLKERDLWGPQMWMGKLYGS